MSKDRIYISVCGEGFGHSSRAIAITEELLSRDCDVILGSYGYVYDYLKKQNLCKVVKIPKEFNLSGENGEFSISKTFLSASKSVLTKYWTLTHKERKIIKNNRITCVLSDGRISPLLVGGYQLGLPAIFITNIVTVKKTFMHDSIQKYILRPPLSLLGKIGSLMLDQIVIPDFLPPNTICRYMLPASPRLRKKTIFVGPVVNKKLYETKPISIKKKTVLSIIGGHAFRKPLIDCVIRTANLNKNFNFIVVSRLIKKHLKKDNLELLPFVDNVYSYLKNSDLVISQSGHSTIMEIICSGKTGIIIPDKKQHEQEAIARRAKEMKLFKTMSYDDLKPKKLISNLEVLNKDKNYKKNVLRLSKLAKKLNGSKKIADLAIEYSSRMTRNNL
jgi:uncharacterized protein (TIGR00661 family)